ncbi:MAG: metal ABC transporter ATP-binding protein [Candidatus Saccharibacteria bacterium]|nr:MAG: metal ABC transporter ATP-binding protein [Candidatus Saccharibacteria bacterium]
MKAIAIDIQDVSVKYHQKTVLHGATAQIPTGAICGLVGMNGAGKSTLFKAIMNAVPLSTGKVFLAGMPVRQAQKTGVVAYVPQTEAIDWNFPVSVEDVVMMGRYGFMNPLRIPTTTDRELVATALKRVHLSDYANRQVGQLSGGQRKRVFVARALAQGATILLLDEPFAGVDAKTEHSLVALLKELQSQGVTTLIAAHDLNTIGSYCDHIILLKQTVVAAGPIKKVFTRENIEKTYDSVMPIKGEIWNI